MKYIKLSLRFFHNQLMKLSWLALLVVLLLHFGVSWGLMWIAGETVLLKHWLYFYITTATTVGFGDLSPAGDTARVLAALFVLPGGVIILATLLGKCTTFFYNFWRKGMLGLGDYSDLQNHIIIFGWHRHRTPKMIELIFGDSRRENRQVLLCTTAEIENPLPEQVLFIRGENFNDQQMIKRTGVRNAARIIVFGESDDQTLATCLSIAASKTKAHIVAWFEKQQMVELLQSHCPTIECHSNLSMELLVRSAQDPGSSRVQHQLLSTLDGPTQYSVRVPDDFHGTNFGRLLEFFKVQHEAIVLGVADSVMGNNLRLNPNSDSAVGPGQIVYYLSAQRIHCAEIQWDKI